MSKSLLRWMLVLVVAAAALPLGGCAEQDDRIEVTLWHQLNYAERVLLADLIERFEAENPGIHVAPLYRETEELRSGYQNSALAGSGPELIHGPSDQVGPFATMGIIRPMEDLFSEEELARLDERAIIWYQGEPDTTEHLYQIADRFGNHLCLIYNKALVDQPPRTIEEMIAIGKANTADLDGDGRRDRYGLVWNYVEPFYFIPFLGGFGGWVMNEDHEPTLNTEATRNAVRFIQSLRDEHRIIPQDADYEIANTLFNEGSAAMVVNGDWSFDYYRENGVDIGVTRIPFVVDEDAEGPRVTEIEVDGETLRGRWPSPIVSPRGFSINPNIERRKLDASMAFIRFILSDDAQHRLAAGTGIMPAVRKLWDDPVITGNPVMSGSKRQIEVARDMPVVPEMRAIWDAMRPNYQAALRGTMPPSEAARRMQEDAERKIREMNEVVQPAGYVVVLQTIAMLLLAAGIWLVRRPFMRFLRDAKRRPFVYWMVLPAFVLIFLTVVYPFFYNIVLSLSNMGLRNFFDWDVVGFSNYLKVFTEPDFYQVLGKTVIWTGTNVVFHVVIGVFIALLLNRALPGRGMIRMLLILPWAVPQYITALTWRGMFNQQYGAINLIIAKYLHLPIVNWLGEPTEAFIACILTNVWLGFPFMMIVALGGLQSIPHQLYEAAEIDGASWWTKLTRITIPLLKPVMAPAVVLGTVWTFNNLNVIWLVSNAGEPSDSTHILVSFVYKSAFNLYRYGYAAAMSMVIFLILLAFGIGFLKQAKATEPVYD